MLKEKMNGGTFYILISENNNGAFGPIEEAGNAVGITLGKQLDSSQFLHEMMHAYRAYNEESAETYNQSTLNGEIEAQYAQYVYNNILLEQGDTLTVKYKETTRRRAITALYGIIDYKGDLLTNSTIEDLEEQINIILNAFNNNSTYSQSKYQYDNSRTALSNFKNLQTITKDCP